MPKNKTVPGVSVIMPFYKQEHFLSRSLAALFLQSFENWELILINDGSGRSLPESLIKYIQDERVVYHACEVNQGLGKSFNYGLERASGKYISYLPADDLIYKDHLRILYEFLESETSAFLAYTSVKHHYNKIAHGLVDKWLQPVQVMHRKTAIRWTERDELETDDLGRLFWNKPEGQQKHISLVSCEWTDHPDQRHKKMQEPEGGINTFRSWYKVKQPLIFHSSKGNYMNEPERYALLKQLSTANITKHERKLKILIVGELAYNPERVIALAERGHLLYGLWMKQPYWYNYVGPLPFDHIIDISSRNWKEEIELIQPDVIYGLLNWQAVPLAHAVVKSGLDIPFAWHFKEGPFICMEKGTWKQLMELYELSDGHIFISEEMKWWLYNFISADKPNLVIDGDLPKENWFMQERLPLLSSQDGEFHTVVPGRPIGLHPQDVQELAAQNIHLHFYGDFTQGQWKQWIEKAMSLAGKYLHIHANIDQENWVREFSQYDAGWLHFFKSENDGEITKANWDDLNIPARLATLAVAGVPMLQYDNSEHIVASQSVIKKINGGLFFTNMQQLKHLLTDEQGMKQVRENLWKQRHLFTFDHHVDALVQFFYSIIDNKKNRSTPILPATTATVTTGTAQK